MIDIMLDSGAHSIYEQIIKGEGRGYEYIETQEFWDYVDRYAEYVKQNLHRLDVYVTVDVIFDPEATWRVQKYLEDTHKLCPLPVFHYGEDFKWLKRYMHEYEYIGIGGLGQDVNRHEFIAHGDEVFRMLCPGKDHLPQWKTHGFAMTSPELVHRWPWYSVDSTSWVMFGRYGIVLVPRKTNGVYDYSKTPLTVAVTGRSPKKSELFQHIDSMGDEVIFAYLIEYLRMKGFVLGESTFEKVIKNKREKLQENVIKRGICNDHTLRDQLNMIYFLDLEKSVPEWPWPLREMQGTLFGG